MARWSDYTTGERIKILRGQELTQEQLTEAAGLSVATIRKAERDWRVSQIPDTGPNKVRTGMEGINARTAQEVHT